MSKHQTDHDSTSTDSCLFCPIEKKTKWYEETDTAILCEKPHGGPMVVLKRHTDEPTEDELEHCHNLVEKHFGKHEFRILMNHVPDHWHAHVRKI